RRTQDAGRRTPDAGRAPVPPLPQREERLGVAHVDGGDAREVALAADAVYQVADLALAVQAEAGVAGQAPDELAAAAGRQDDAALVEEAERGVEDDVGDQTGLEVAPDLGPEPEGLVDAGAIHPFHPAQDGAGLAFGSGHDAGEQDPLGIDPRPGAAG